MPIYEYICLDCRTEFEVFQKSVVVNETVFCPSCNSKNVKKQISRTVYPAWSTFLDKMDRMVKKKPWD